MGKDHALEHAESMRRKKLEEESERRSNQYVAGQLIKSGAIQYGKAPSCCPACGSIHEWKKTNTCSKGFSAEKAAVGTAIAGAARAVVGGAMGRKVDTYYCTCCGFTEDYPHDENNMDGSEALSAAQQQIEAAKTPETQQETTWGQIIMLLVLAAFLWFLVIQVASCTH